MDVTNEEEYKRVQRRELAREKNRPKPVPAMAKNGFLRVIGGDLRSRKIQFRIDPDTRPMKDRTREAIFNLLGKTIKDTIAIDLFAGSGILAFESVSRGATYAVAVEKIPFRASEIVENAKRIDLLDSMKILTGDAFKISFNPSKVIESLELDEVARNKPWTLFCCPPYELWSKAPDDMRDLVVKWMEHCPVDSNLVIELEQATAGEFLFEDRLFDWLRRDYRPATVAIGTKLPQPPT